MYRVEIFHWVHGSGFSHNETFEEIEEYCSAKEYIKSLDEPLPYDPSGGTDILVKIFKEEQYNTDDPLSEAWVSDVYQNKIKELRRITGLSQKAFGEKYHIPTRTVENWEAGSRKPSETILYLLERAVREDSSMTYVIIDDCTSKTATVWDVKFQTKEEAMQEAKAEWDALTDHDKARRDAYYVAVCRLDEDGEIDWDTVDPIITYK